MIKQFYQYKVSDDGHVWLSSGREVSYHKTPSSVTIAMKIPVHYRNTYNLGEVVYACFNEDTLPKDFWTNRHKYIICHIDGNVFNNHLENLQLTLTKKEQRSAGRIN